MLDKGGVVEAFGSQLTLPPEMKFGDIAAAQKYVDLVWAAVGSDRDPPLVRRRRGHTKAHYERVNHVIALPDHDGIIHSWAMRELVLLHEVAHALNDTSSESHGPKFCAILVALVSEFIGPEVGFLLAAEYSERGVQIASTMV